MKKLLLFSLIALIFSSCASKKVLYVTHEPGRYHKYGPQKDIFIDVATKEGWDLTVSSGEHDPQIVELRDAKLLEGYDAIVYNFCFAHSNDLEAAANIISQTRENGTPAMVIHCAMHSFWSTFKFGQEGALGKEYKGHALADPKLVAAWKTKFPNRPFPVWGDFTGIASTQHGPKSPITIEKCCPHEATKSLSDKGYLTTNAELYNNFYVLDNVQPLLKGTQAQLPKAIFKKISKGIELTPAEQAIKAKMTTSTLMWLSPQGKSQVLGLTIGHDLAEWQQPEFQLLLKDGVNFLLND